MIEKIVEDEFAIEPYEEYHVSPVSGTIAHIGNRIDLKPLQNTQIYLQ